MSKREENGIWPYSVISHVLGQIFDFDDDRLAVRHFSPQERERIGRRAAEFSLWMAGAIDKEIFNAEIAPQFPDWRHQWMDYDWRFGQLALFNDPEFPSLTAAAAELYTLRYKAYPLSFKSYPSSVLHGDLHLSNMLFTGSELSGVIDFCSVWTGRLADEGYRLAYAGCLNGWNNVLAAHGHEPLTAEQADFRYRADRVVYAVFMIHNFTLVNTAAKKMA